jgi:hypothetical protein
MTALLVIIIVLIVAQITFSLLDSKKIDRIESKLDAIEAKTPYKKRVRKLKVAGVEVPIEAQETKSANANGTEIIIDNTKTNKEEHEENN